MTDYYDDAIEYDFESYEELIAFLDKNADDTRLVWYWGPICNFNDVYYDLAELRKEACSEWFEADEEEYSDEPICQVWDCSGYIEYIQKEKLEEFLDLEEGERAAWLEEKKAHTSYEDSFKIEYKLCLEAMHI